jgi:peptidoglycan/LPS O-acetylase OafA/YrhL
MIQENNIKILRAIAVTAVVLYHISNEIFKSGYLGVDIFFIISGYLLLPKLANLSLKNIVNLYVSRIKRIYPGLISVCVFFGLLIYFITNINNTNIIIKSLLGLSNIFYFKNTDYFNENSQLNPFLHLWSLSVELQFYALLPLFGFFFNKSRYILLIILLISLIYFIINNSNGAGFYLIQGRIWEFAIGGYIAIFANKKYKQSYAPLLFLIIFIFLGENNNYTFL